MKLNKGIMITVIALGTTVTAFAAGTIETISAKVQTFSQDKMPTIPEGVALMEKEILEDEMSVEVKTYDKGEMPTMPEGAPLMNKDIIEK